MSYQFDFLSERGEWEDGIRFIIYSEKKHRAVERKSGSEAKLLLSPGYPFLGLADSKKIHLLSNFYTELLFVLI